MDVLLATVVFTSFGMTNSIPDKTYPLGTGSITFFLFSGV